MTISRRRLSRLQSARRIFDRLDWWSVNEWADSDLWSFRDGDAALLLVPLDVANADALDATHAVTAWVRWCAVADDGSALTRLQAVFSSAEARLASHGVREAWCIVRSSDWLKPYLRDLGYRSASRLLTFQVESWRVAGEQLLPAGVQLRPAHADDLDAVCDLDARTFDEPWRYPPALMRPAFERSFAFIVASCSEGIVGYACSSLSGESGHIVRLAIHPSLRRRGIGSGLLMDGVARLIRAGARAVSLNTQGDNRSAQRLYRRLGFVLLDERAVVVRKRLIHDDGGGAP